MAKDYIKNISDKAERRFYGSPVEVRDNGSGGKVFRGYAALYNSWSNDLGGFIERIAPGAFDNVLGANPDVRALFNHDPNYVLGRTLSGTLRIGSDSAGLWMEYNDPGTTWSRDLAITMERGDINQMSFAFSLAENGDKLERDGEIWKRTLTQVSDLYDVSVVTYPAYNDTTVTQKSIRSLIDREKELENLGKQILEQESAERDHYLMKSTLRKSIFFNYK